jgi:hypothetical protein
MPCFWHTVYQTLRAKKTLYALQKLDLKTLLRIFPRQKEVVS